VHYRGYQFDQIITTAKRLIPQLRKRVGLVVLLAHSGFERDPQSSTEYPGQTPGEKAVWALAEQVPGIDVILWGHG
jgi:2',3'-cyclic-nucleotide 2'-phosphodiesterase (5'-nucleotidase family)